MSNLTIGKLVVECIQGDIVQQKDIEAIVNAANAELMPGGGVAGAIHRAAGPGLAAECAPLAPIGPGQAVITGAHRLPNRYVIHCLGPVYGRDEPADVLLRLVISRRWAWPMAGTSLPSRFLRFRPARLGIPWNLPRAWRSLLSCRKPVRLCR